MARPPILEGGHVRYLLHCGAPMGFVGSAAWAQSVADQTTTVAGLPPSRQLRQDLATPPRLPCRASAMDDIWAAE
eukprot:65417-Lingulodinium_polyedra.AAC.1